MKVSVIIPSKGCQYLEYTLRSLKNQTMKPYEVVLVLKDCDIRKVEELTKDFNSVVVEQKRGFVTHAMNLGKREARGDLLLSTDDDAIPLERWIERYIKLHRMYRNVAGISSRDIYLDLNTIKLKPTPDDTLWVRIFRWFVRPIISPPHPLLKKYKLGVYITKNFEIAHGPCIPRGVCYSLPFRGVNMSFKAEFTYEIQFPEHPRLVSGLGFEQYFGLQIILRGFDTIYVPNNPVLHIIHRSISRSVNKDEIRLEMEVLKALLSKFLKNYAKSHV